jgi:hypothetical protein
VLARKSVIIALVKVWKDTTKKDADMKKLQARWRDCPER